MIGVFVKIKFSMRQIEIIDENSEDKHKLLDVPLDKI